MATNKKNGNKTKKQNVVNEKKEPIIVKENKQEIIKQNITIALLVVICLILLVILIFVIKGHEVKLKDGKEIVASIDGKDVTAEDLFNELKRQNGNGTTMIVNTIDDFIANKELENTDEIKKEANARLASLKLQYQQMGYDFNTVLISSGFENEEELLQQLISDYKKEAVAKKYISNHLTEDEINAYYENEIYGKLTVKHILIRPDTTSTSTNEEKTAAEEAAKARAQEVIQKLKDGAAWADLVKEYSDDTGSKEDEGLIEIEDKDSVVEEFFKASIALTDNNYTQEPVKSQFGYHVILRIKQDEKPSLDSVKENVKTKLVSNKIANDTKLLDKTWVSIRKDYKLKINDTKLEKIYNNIIKDFE